MSPKDIFSKLTHWYFSKRALPHWCILIIDCSILIVTAFIVYALNNGIVHTASHFWPLLWTFTFYLLFYILGFRVFSTYSGIIRYSSFVDLQRVFFATGIGFILTLIVKYTCYWLDFSWPVFIRTRDLLLTTLISTALMWSVRVLVKYFYDTLYKSGNAQKAYIYGIKEGGISIAKSLRNQDGPSNFAIAGFVCDDDDSQNSILMGVRVHKITDSLVEKMKKDGIKALFVSPLRSESLRENIDFVNSLIEAGIKIYMMPDKFEWDGKSNIAHSQLREVEIEDLLPREKITVDINAIRDKLVGKRILITGAAGSIGSEIVNQVASFAPSLLILIDQAETPLHDVRLHMGKGFPNLKALTIVADIANKSRMHDIFKEYKPEFVFHAAAYKHVPMMEDNPAESIQNNVEGTRILADLSVKFGAKKFVMVSTDKAVNPTNVMGCSKRICEIYVQSLDKAIKNKEVEGQTQFVTTRFGNVLGSNGSVIPLFKRQIKEGGPITVTHPDIIRYFMLISEACKLVLEAGTMGNGGEIFVFDMGKPVKIVDLAKRMIKLSGANIQIKFTGLREGEKLYEEVLNNEEKTIETFHPKIKIAKVRDYDYSEVNADLDNLLKISFTSDDMEIVRYMKKIVPEFKSQNNAIYEKLDKENAKINDKVS